MKFSINENIATLFICVTDVTSD